jgi:hypothetical protein
MNVARGMRRISAVLLVCWVALYVWYFGSGWKVLFFPRGTEGETCNTHFSSSRVPEDVGWGMLCNYMTDGDYPLFARIMFERALVQILVLIAVPIGAWMGWRILKWIVRGFQAT